MRKLIIGIFMISAICGCHTQKNEPAKNTASVNQPENVNFIAEWKNFKCHSETDSDTNVKIKKELENIFIKIAKFNHAQLIALQFSKGLFYEKKSGKSFSFTGTCDIFDCAKRKQLNSIKNDLKPKFILQGKTMTFEHPDYKITLSDSRYSVY